ncbi:MAG: HD domain-containing protein [Defluviitaleaceae bacterium]|nr:HD domain-containing protein [Defluviitaleaceae bacterium]
MRPEAMVKHTFTGNTKVDVKSLLYACGKAKTYDHAKAVAEISIKIAKQYGMDTNVCELSGYLHDIGAVIAPRDMLVYAEENGWHIDECERMYPFLLHQRISRIIAQEDFHITDERILSAVEHHTTR